jgi:methyl-accepting chemotaxis protein
MNIMSEPIRITPEVLREVAGGHDEVVRHIEAARERGGDIAAAVESYGPIMHQVKAAVGDLLLDRDNALAGHAGRHRRASDELQRAAHVYTDVDDQNAQQIAEIADL